MGKVEKPNERYTTENMALYQLQYFQDKIIDTVNELVEWYGNCANNERVPIERVREPGHWECEDCKHVYSKDGCGAAFMPIGDDGEEYNCIFCEPGGGTVKWIPDKEPPVKTYRVKYGGHIQGQHADVHAAAEAFVEQVKADIDNAYVKFEVYNEKTKEWDSV